MTGETVARASALPRSSPVAFAGGAIIGALGGLIGLGGAEFRLPLLIGVFRFAALQAVILNKAMSLVVVASALPFRARTVPFLGRFPLRLLRRTGRSSSTCLPAVCLVRGSGPGGQRGSHRTRFIASSLCCCSGSRSFSCSGITPGRPRARCSQARRR